MFRSVSRVLAFSGRISSINAPRLASIIPRRCYAANVPTDLKYTDQHEWIRLDGDIATLGITDHAQDQLGEVVYCDLPDVGAFADKLAGALCVIESVKAVSDIFSPLTGEVTEVNTKLEEEPDKINNDPYNEGWLVKLKITEKGELSELMDADAYSKLIEES